MIVLISCSQALIGPDDGYLRELQEQVAMAKMSLGATVKSLEEAVQESESVPPESELETLHSGSEPPFERLPIGSSPEWRERCSRQACANTSLSMR
jgi:hypothetical protein